MSNLILLSSSKRGNVFFSPGPIEDMETEDLPPLIDRIWCQEKDLRGTNKTIAPSPSMTRPPASDCFGTIVDIAMEDGRFTILLAALMAAELANTLSGPGPFTVFGKFLRYSISLFYDLFIHMLLSSVLFLVYSSY